MNAFLQYIYKHIHFGETNALLIRDLESGTAIPNADYK